MSSEIVIRVDQLGKSYQVLAEAPDRQKQSFWKGKKQESEDFWALSDISFEVKKGEMVGVIGRNGSGKSTLLQMICGTLTPTTGEIQTHGRIAALLELGAGFNPQFTGSENIYVNGAILGLTRAEIDARYDEIVAFADIGRFMDQPVKTYSSGMFVRLAFAIQACVEPDILVVDEALAVGDVFYRQKCYKRLAQLRARGCSILLVTHSMGDVEQLCQWALLLDHGKALFMGPSTAAVKRYYLVERGGLAADASLLEQNNATQVSLPTEEDEHFWPNPESFLNISAVPQISNGWARCTGVALCDANNQVCHSFRQGDTARFFYEFEMLRDIEVPIAGIVIQDDHGLTVHGKSTLEYGSHMPVRVDVGQRLKFRHDITLEIAGGEYTFEVGLATMDVSDYGQRASYPFMELRTKWIRLCHLPNVGHFSVILRPAGIPVALLHHGIANLPGHCHLVNFSGMDQ